MTVKKKRVFLIKIIFFYFFVSVLSVFADDTYTLKIGTLAPENSSWVQSINDISERVYQKTQGKVKIILYTGGVMGD
jgi:TRAP-type C4-dicarboxylate transport system substrate-binding protein